MLNELYLMDSRERGLMYAQSTHFNLHYNERKKYNEIYSVLSLLCGVKNRKELWCIITNTARAIRQQARFMQIPRDNDVYVSNKQGISRRKMTTVLDQLVESGYFVFFKGGFINLRKNDLAPSLYEITDKMKELWKDIDIEEELVYDGDLIEIKDRKTKEQLNSNIRGTAEIRSVVGRYNYALSTVDLMYDGMYLPVQQYKRVFSDSLHLGGRFYNVSGGVQTMKQEDRKKLMINGEKVVELDFKALHPSILYEKKWQENPRLVEYWIENSWDGAYNPYITKGFEAALYIDEEEVADQINRFGLTKYNPVRNLFKFAVMTCLNAKRGEKRPITPAAKALTSEWYDDLKKKDQDRKYRGLHVIDGNFPSHAICELVQAANLPIGDSFFSDVGVELQRIDSDIIEQVISSLVEMGEVLYPEHDSVIVRESIEHDVTRLMREAYFNVIGSDQFCFIEKK